MTNKSRAVYLMHFLNDFFGFQRIDTAASVATQRRYELVFRIPRYTLHESLMFWQYRLGFTYLENECLYDELASRGFKLWM